MTLNLFDPESFHRSGGDIKISGNLSGFAATGEGGGPIHSSKDVSGIELRMLPPLIIENHTAPVWPFPGYSKLYCLTIVVSDATNQLAGAIDIKGFPRIGDQEYLPVNKTIFYWQASSTQTTPPNQVHMMCSIIKSKKDLRDMGKIMGELKDDTDYKSAISTLGKIAKNAAEVNVVTDLVAQIGSLVGKHLGQVEDKPIGTILNSYTTVHGDFDELGVKKLVYPTKDVQFNFDLTVRNATAEATIEKEVNIRGFAQRRKASVNLGKSGDVVHVDMQPLL